MTQMKLIANSRDEWTVKELVETLHAKVDDLERKLDAQLKLNDSIQRHLHAIVLHLTGDRAALTAFAMASEPTVVPNEDEAMPVVEPTIVQDEPGPRKNERLRMPDDVRSLSQCATKLAREGQALIKQAMDNATANSGRMSLDDKKLLDAGTVKMTEAKRLQSEYNSKRERITYPNGRK